MRHLVRQKSTNSFQRLNDMARIDRRSVWQRSSSSFALETVEKMVEKVFLDFDETVDVHSLPGYADRETVSVAKHLRKKSKMNGFTN